MKIGPAGKIGSGEVQASSSEIDNATQKADLEMNKEGSPYKALLILQAAVEKYPQYAKDHPDLYYSLALYAYAASDLPKARKYLAEASLYMGSDDARIKELSTQINNPGSAILLSDKIRDLFSTVLGDGPVVQQSSQRIENALANWKPPITEYADANAAWQASPSESSGEIGKGGTFEYKKSSLDKNKLGPGYWGYGSTIARAQADAFQWSLAQEQSTAEGGDWRGPFSTTSNFDPVTSSVTIAEGGKGLSEYRLSAYAGLNLYNAEERFYDKLMDAGTVTNSALAGKWGVGGSLGMQARLDQFDLQGGLNYCGASASIGDSQINSLLRANLAGQLAVGSQVDATVSLSLGQKTSLGASLGAFSGAQASGFAGATIDGVGANVYAQAWAGLGAKATLSFDFQNGKLVTDLGLGAALGVGGYLGFAANIDLNQVADSIRAVEQKIDTQPGLFGAIGILQAPSQLVSEIKKEPGEAFHDAGQAIKEGGIVTAVTDSAAGSFKWIGKKLVGLFK